MLKIAMGEKMANLETKILKTGSGTSGSSGSAGTAVFRHLESQDSTASEGGIGRQSSISIREWDIPFEELEIKEPIGTGRFSSGTKLLLKFKTIYIQLCLFNSF